MEKQQNDLRHTFSSASANEEHESGTHLESVQPPPLQLKINNQPPTSEPESDHEETQLKEYTNAGSDEPPADEDPNKNNQPFQLKASTNNTGLPVKLKSGMEQLSGFSMDDVNVHYNSDKPAQLQAHAYAQGSDIHIGPGQEKNLPHEAWHVVQQKQGRVQPTTQLKAFNINDDEGLEKEADEMGSKAANLSYANQNSKLNAYSGFQSSIVQRDKKEEEFEQNEINLSINDVFDLEAEPFAKHMAQKIWVEILEEETQYAFKGMGGGGARKINRSKEVRAFRGEMKERARLRVFDEIDSLEHTDTATGDYQRMVAGNIAYDEVKEVIDVQLKIEAGKLINDIYTSKAHNFIGYVLTNMRGLLYKLPQDVDAMRRGQFPTIPQDEKKKRYKKMLKEVESDVEGLRSAYHDLLKARKDEIIGKTNPNNTETDKGAGKEVIDRVVDRVSADGIARKSLEQAIHAPTIGKGMKILGLLIDNVIPDSGEMVELTITFLIPTPQPGLEVEINLSGAAARGIDGATTAGVAVMGNPKRVEIAAKFSVGARAEAIGLKSDGTIGIFVRAGSDSGTEAALQALSYGAYRGAWPEAFQNLWAPQDKATKVRKSANKKIDKANQEAEAKAKKIIADNNTIEDTKRAIRNETQSSNDLEQQWTGDSTSIGDLPPQSGKHKERSRRLRAEMWAAMIEEKYFKGTDGQTFADVGLAIDGGFGINLGAVQMELGLTESIFSHYDEEVLDRKLKGQFAKKVDGEEGAQSRRDLAKGDKKLALGGSISLTIGAGPHKIELGLSISGSKANNWGVEIVGGATTAADQAGPTTYDKLMNGWVTGLGEMIKKLRSTASKQMNDDNTGVWGNMFQVLADGTALVDVGSDHGIRSGMEGLRETVTDVNPTEGVHFDTKVGNDIASDATTKTNLWSASTMLLFVFTFGNNGGHPVVRFELRSKRGMDIGAGTPINVSMSKTTRLFAIGKELDGKVHGEIAGGRVQ